MTNNGKQVALSLRDIKITFGDVVAVNGVSFDLYEGEVIGLIGENGAGKSTLLKILSGIYKADEGSIELGGKEVKFRNPEDSLAAGIGVVHQEQSLFTNLSVAENMDISVGKGGSSSSLLGLYNWGAVNKSAAKTLAKIGSKLDPRTKVGDLAFVDRQMVEIAKAIRVGESSNSKPIVILDEPTSLLEPHETAYLEREISKLRDIGSVIFVSHRLEEVIRVCDRILVLRDGELVAVRTKEAVDEAELFRLMIGREAKSEKREYRRDVSVEAPVIEVRNLNKRGKFRDVNLRLAAGEITAIVGTNASGREELCKALYGADPADSGTMLVRGKEVHGWNVQRAIRAGFGLVPSERKVEGMVGGLTAASNLSLIFGGDSQVGPFINPKKLKKVADDWFEKLDIRPRNPRLELERFSGGNQQKVVMAKWLKSEELSLLILDHPLRGLDPGAAGTVNELIQAAVKNNTSVLLLADTLEEALEMGDQIIVMRDGEISSSFDLHKEQPTSLDLLEKMV
jgi:ribose transport system ATP-binding protein